jgi:hypothetical protein
MSLYLHSFLRLPDGCSSRFGWISIPTLLLALFITGGGLAQAQDTDRAIGFVTATPDHAFVYTTRDHLAPTTLIQFQYSTKQGEFVCCARLTGKDLDAPRVAPDPVSDALLGQPVFRYPIKKIPESLRRAPFIGAAAIGNGWRHDIPIATGLALKTQS